MVVLSENVEVTIHGRGGGGVVSAGYIIAVAAFYDNKFSQAFPMFGTERSGAPVTSYVRISDKEIYLRSQIYEPDYSIVLDPSIASHVDVSSGVQKAVIVNSKNAVKLHQKTFIIDSSRFGDSFGNIAVVAAFAKCTGIVSQGSLLKAIDEIFSKKGKEIVNKNTNIVNSVFSEKSCPLELGR